jgi:predicted N-acetyltransferase YhbS
LVPRCETHDMIELVTGEDVVPLRHMVLRPNLPVSSARYPEDAHPEIFHLGHRGDDGTIIACVTFLPQPIDGEPAWRFRGLATAEQHRNRGVGGRLIEAGLAEVIARGGKVVWCNGRSAAASFYQRHGFTIRGEEFDVAPIGQHYVFVRALT